MGGVQCCCREDGKRIDEEVVTAGPVLEDKGTQTVLELTSGPDSPRSPRSPQKPRCDKTKKAASLAARLTNTFKQQMDKAWTALKGEIVAQKLVMINVPYRSEEERRKCQKWMQHLDAAMDLSCSDTAKACLALEGLLIKHKAVLSQEILVAGTVIKHFFSLTECRTTLSNILLAIAKQGKTSQVLTSGEIEFIVNGTDLGDERLAGDIKQLLTMTDCENDNFSENRSTSNTSISTVSTGLSDESQ